MVKEFNLKDADELYEKIGLGERLAPLGRAAPAAGARRAAITPRRRTAAR